MQARPPGSVNTAAMFYTKTVEPPNMEMNKLQLPLQLYLAGSLQPIRIDDVHVCYLSRWLHLMQES